MREISFSIPVSGTVSIDENSITVIINNAKTAINLEPVMRLGKRSSFGPGKNLFDIVLESAREAVRNGGVNRFTAAQLFHTAIETYPDLKRNSWTSHVIASAPNHTSYQHYASRRDFFRYLGDGSYQLKPQFLKGGNIHEPGK